eukprot:3555840-Pyramimonas_sp.AAC.1
MDSRALTRNVTREVDTQVSVAHLASPDRPLPFPWATSARCLALREEVQKRPSTLSAHPNLVRTGHDAQQQMLSSIDGGRCWASDLPSQMDN